MKYWAVPLVAAILFLGYSPCHSQAPVGYIGLFAGEHHGPWCVEGEGFYPVEMWIWCLPSFNGQICSEFAISYPPNVIKSTFAANVAILAVTLPGCIMCEDNICKFCCCYNSCQMDWHWMCHQLLYVTDQTPSYCEIIPNPDVGAYHFANCDDGYPFEPCIKYTNLYFNYSPGDPECSVTAVEVTSWGAIKSLFR